MVKPKPKIAAVVNPYLSSNRAGCGKKVVINPYLRKKQSVATSTAANKKISSSSSSASDDRQTSVKGSSLANPKQQHQQQPQQAKAKNQRSSSGGEGGGGTSITTTTAAVGSSSVKDKDALVTKGTTKKTNATSVAKKDGSSSNSRQQNSNANNKATTATKRAAPPKSLKSKLKQEIENIRRATLLEKEQKRLRKEQKALEKRRKEQERLEAIEAEKRKKLAEEQEKLRQQLEQERLAKEKLEQEERRKRLLEEQQQRQRTLLLQQQQQKEAAINIDQIMLCLIKYHKHLPYSGYGLDTIARLTNELEAEVDERLPKSDEMRQCMLSLLQLHPQHQPQHLQEYLVSSSTHRDQSLRLVTLLQRHPLTNIGWKDIMSPTESIYPHSQQLQILFSGQTMMMASNYQYPPPLTHGGSQFVMPIAQPQQRLLLPTATPTVVFPPDHTASNNTLATTAHVIRTTPPFPTVRDKSVAAPMIPDHNPSSAAAASAAAANNADLQAPTDSTTTPAPEAIQQQEEDDPIIPDHAGSSFITATTTNIVDSLSSSPPTSPAEAVMTTTTTTTAFTTVSSPTTNPNENDQAAGLAHPVLKEEEENSMTKTSSLSSSHASPPSGFGGESAAHVTPGAASQTSASDYETTSKIRIEETETNEVEGKSTHVSRATVSNSQAPVVNEGSEGQTITTPQKDDSSSSSSSNNNTTDSPREFSSKDTTTPSATTTNTTSPSTHGATTTAEKANATVQFVTVTPTATTTNNNNITMPAPLPSGATPTQSSEVPSPPVLVHPTAAAEASSPLLEIQQVEQESQQNLTITDSKKAGNAGAPDPVPSNWNLGATNRAPQSIESQQQHKQQPEPASSPTSYNQRLNKLKNAQAVAIGRGGGTPSTSANAWKNPSYHHHNAYQTHHQQTLFGGGFGGYPQHHHHQHQLQGNPWGMAYHQHQHFYGRPQQHSNWHQASYSGQYQNASGGQYPYQSQLQLWQAALQWQQGNSIQQPQQQPYSSLLANAALPLPYMTSAMATQPTRTPKVPRAPRQRKPKPPVVQRLAFDPIELPSPYAHTHEVLLTQTIIIVKKPGESFGVSLREDKQSALVELEWFKQNEARMKRQTVAPDAGPTTNTNQSSLAACNKVDKNPKKKVDGPQPTVEAISMEEVKKIQDELKAFAESAKVEKTTEEGTALGACTAEKAKEAELDIATKDTAADGNEAAQAARACPATAVTEKVATSGVKSPSIPTLADVSKEPVQVSTAHNAEEQVDGPRAELPIPMNPSFDRNKLVQNSQGADSDAKGSTKESVNCQNQSNQSHELQAGTASFKALPALPEKQHTPWQPTGTFVQPQKARRPRRKRNHFSVLMVVDAAPQNERIDNTMHLQAGDIILSVNGTSTGGHIFKEACTLFGKGCVEKEDEEGGKSIQCSLTIARRKPPPQPKVKPSPALPKFSAPASTESAVQALMDSATALKPLTDTDLKAYSDCVMRAFQDSQRMLGSCISDSLLQKVVEASPDLADCQALSLKSKWEGILHAAKREVVKSAADFWTKEWQKEREKYPASVKSKHLSDAKRAEMRAAPRPVVGCKCGGQDHDYVDDVRCPLYTDILPLSKWNRKAREQHKKSSKNKGDESRTLNSVETAFKERFVKQQAEKKALEEEASFVEEMERLQVKKLKKAIFAPSLTAMVLSSVFELQTLFPPQTEQINPLQPQCEDVKMDDAGGKDDTVEEEEDDDDIPLAALGKREGSIDSPGTVSKKQKRENTISKKFLAELLLLVSKRWGHLYREQDDSDFAWRWEVFHGQTETDGRHWEAQTTNPRGQGNYSFEYLRFVISKEFIAACTDQVAANGAKTNQAHVLLAHLVSPECTGLYDELLALQKFGILDIKNGVPKPARDWYSRVDLLLLNEMYECWSPTADKSGKFMVSNKMRRKLQEKWVVSEHGFALREDPDDIIYDFDEWEEWRNNFEEKQQAKSENLHGIGRFGL